MDAPCHRLMGFLLMTRGFPAARALFLFPAIIVAASHGLAIGTFPEQSYPPVAPPPNQIELLANSLPNGLVIHEADYGNEDGRCDAVPQVRELCQNRLECYFYVSESLCDLPASDKERYLSLVYSCEQLGRPRYLEAAREVEVNLNCYQ